MQLTVDTGAPMDIEFKMTTIKEVTLNKITSLMVNDEDVKNSGDILKDITSDFAENNDEEKNRHFNDKVAQDDATASIVENQEIEKRTSEETSTEDCESKSHNSLSRTNESNKPEDIVNLIKQKEESESQNKLSSNNSEEKENVTKIDTTKMLDTDKKEEKLKSTIAKTETTDQIKSNDNINSKDHEHTTSDSKTDKEITLQENKIIDKNLTDRTINDIKTGCSILESATDKVPSKANEKDNQSLEEVTGSQSENSVSPISSKIENDANIGINSDSASDSTLKNATKTDNNTKESVTTIEDVTSVETDIKSSTIEIEDENVEEINTHNNKENNEEVESKVCEEKKESTLISKLTNILDLLSDDEEERHEDTNNGTSNVDKQCISLVDDDDVMLVDEDSNVKEDACTISDEADKVSPAAGTTPNQQNKDDEIKDDKQESGSEGVVKDLENNVLDNEINEIKENTTSKPLLSLNFLNTCKKTLSDMTREDLEEFCSLKIIESVMERSNLGDLKSQLKTMAVTVEEFKKKANLLSKQNRDLQLVLKSVQEEQKKSSGTAITPLKITRSVGIQVLMTEKANVKRKNAPILNSSVTPQPQPSLMDKTNRSPSAQKVQKTKNQSIPVPRLVPASNTSNKTSPAPASSTVDPGKSPQVPPLINGVKNSPSVLKPEKRPRVQSVTVDLTDDEPPLKVTAKSSPAPGVRLVPAQNLLPPQRPPFATAMTSPRKVYIPISAPQPQNVRPGPAVLFKSGPAPVPGVRPRLPPANNNGNKVQPNTIRMNRPAPGGRHPAPLPDAVKQYQPTSWRALPPAPDLKLSKVENGIVISWKIDGYQEDSYEEITSYQLFAYQETNSPPSTALWKKIGDVKALPLPMACTLTQFLAGYKYYFAVRAVDIKSRFGPFSLPASILLLNKI